MLFRVWLCECFFIRLMPARYCSFQSFASALFTDSLNQKNQLIYIDKQRRSIIQVVIFSQISRGLWSEYPFETFISRNDASSNIAGCVVASGCSWNPQLRDRGATVRKRSRMSNSNGGLLQAESLICSILSILWVAFPCIFVNLIF